MQDTLVGFPRELLNQPWTARIQYFRTYTMAHPWLVDRSRRPSECDS